MKVLIAGGFGFLGTALANFLTGNQHEVLILTRHAPKRSNQIQWDGKTTLGWDQLINEVDAVVHLTGFGLEHWPWTKRQKQRFVDSRVIPGLALISAIKNASRRPSVFLQTSGINRYGLIGEGVADETTPPADDFLAQLTVKWETTTEPIEKLGVRRVVTRNAVVLSKRGGLFPLMALPVRLFFGGKFGTGRQAMPWIHIEDYIKAVRILLENENANGPYNLISPAQTSNEEFMREIAKTLHRPFWFHVPEFLLGVMLGEMNILLTKGRYAQPRRLLELGYKFQFAQLDDTIRDLLE